MIGKLKQLHTRLEKHFENNPDQEITLSDEIYSLLTQEAKEINALVKLVEDKRNESLLRVLL